MFDSGVLVLDLILEVGTLVDGQLSENRFSVFFPVVLEEPTWGLGAELDKKNSSDGEYDLQSERYSELGLILDERQAVVDPVCGHLRRTSVYVIGACCKGTTTYHSEDVDRQLDGESTASVVSLGCLRVPDRYCRGVDTGSSAYLSYLSSDN